MERKGIIYRAYNKITGKSYIGQTVQKLNERIRGHYFDSKRYDYKFSRALKKYDKEEWIWTILIESEQYKLNYYEKHFIKEFGAINFGYNCREGGMEKQKKTSNKTYNLYHPNYGEINLTRQELLQISDKFDSGINHLVAEKYKHVNGFVLVKNKKYYNQIMHIYTFYHPDYGEITCSKKELATKYNLKEASIRTMISRKSILYGWKVISV